MQEIPVYLIVGFLDSGKTQFINGILEEGFAAQDRTLLLSCEEGEIPYDSRFLGRTTVVPVEDPDTITPLWLHSLEKQYKPKQVLVEYNGMWPLSEFESKLPGNWLLYQIMCLVDAGTFSLYAQNMGQIMMEKLRLADMIAFNRCTPELKAELRKRNLRLVNRRADIFLEETGGEAEDYRDGTVSCFDLSAPVIEIGDQDFGFFYVELMDHPEMYQGKTVRFKGVACRDKQLGNFITIGRHAMVCCAEDITYCGLPAYGPGQNILSTRDWAVVTGTVEVAYWKLYQGEGPILHLTEVTPCQKPSPELVQF